MSLIVRTRLEGVTGAGDADQHGLFPRRGFEAQHPVERDDDPGRHVPFAIDPLPARERYQPAIGGNRLLHRRIAATKPSALAELFGNSHEQL